MKKGPPKNLHETSEHAYSHSNSSKSKKKNLKKTTETWNFQVSRQKKSDNKVLYQ
jgi:hypothetical protein